MDKPQFTPVETASLHLAYQRAVYEVCCDRQVIQLFIGQSNSELERLLSRYNVKTWALITAFNPYSQCLSAVENLQRHQQLLEYLQTLPYRVLTAWGKDLVGDWSPEESVFILGIAAIRAREIGQKFEQNAIVYGEFGKPPQLQWLQTFS